MGVNAEDSAKRIGETLRDKWVIEELLGIGGMASVYAARHKIGRRDAIKILHANIAESEQLRARFEQEAHAVNAFRHPGVVEIRDVDTTEDGAPFLVMELLEGESLAQRLSREGVLEPRVMLEIAAQVLDVLAAAHPRGIVHRDIKPDNLFLSKDGTVKVLDFGVARVRSEGRKALRTEAGIALGTMAFMAPEQARGEAIDGRADLYAVGATIFRSLAGRIVHDAGSQAELVMRVVAHGAPRLRTVLRDVDANVAALVDRALAFELPDRYPDASVMLADVRAVLAGNPPPYASTAPEIPDRPRARQNEGKMQEVSASSGTPTVVPPARQQPGPVGHAPPAASAPTQVSQEGALPSGTASSVPLSERVVIVPPQHGHTVSMSSSGGPSAGTFSLGTHQRDAPAPPPGGPAAHANLGGRWAEPPLTPAEHTTLVRKGPTLTILAIGGGVATLALILLTIVLVWVLTSSSSSNKDVVVSPPITTTTPTVGTRATTEPRTPSTAPPLRRSGK